MAKQEEQKQAAPLRRAIGLREFSESLSVSYDSAYRRAQTGELRTIRFGSRILVPFDEAERVAKEGL
jgi:hypothetical protein